MKITKILAAMGLFSIVGTAASAATFNLADQYRASSSSITVTDDGLSMTVYGYNGGSQSTVRTHRGYGLSVGNHMIDGREGVMLGFSETVALDSFYAGYVDRYDEYRVYGWNGSDWDHLQYGHMGYGNGGNNSRATVDMAGAAANYGSRWFWIGTDDRWDEFKLRSISADRVSAVPLPAGGVLLLSALGLVALRRKKS